MTYHYAEFKSPIGPLHIVSNGQKIVALVFDNAWKNVSKKNPLVLQPAKDALIKETEKQLVQYFAGTRKEFTLPVQFNGTEFQNSVWKSLLLIPYGKTATYAKQAELIKNPKAVRAVGGANAKNPISIIVPCHRVIGKNGALTGFAGGLEIKKQLLALEKSS